MKIIHVLTGIFVFFNLTISNADDDNKTKEIDCGAGDSLAHTLQKAKTGTTVIVSGTCHEAVTINKAVSLIGNNAIIDGSTFPEVQDLLTIDGALQVKITGISIKNGARGLVSKGGANVTASNLTIENNQSFGIDLLEGSFMSLSDSSIAASGANGLNVQDGSNIKITGNLKVTDSGTFGINLQDGAHVTITDATITANQNLFGIQFAIGVSVTVTDSTVEASNNQLLGMTVDSGSSLFSFNSHFVANNNQFLDGFGANTNSNIDLDKDSSITANNNGRDGLNIEATLLNLFVFFTPIGPKLEANNNGRHGVYLTLGSKLDLAGAASLTASGNGQVGLLLEDGSAANLNNAQITNNGDGTTKDVELVFASRANFIAGNTVGNIACDPHSFTKGEVSCP